jgi:hypothetical protein
LVRHPLAPCRCIINVRSHLYQSRRRCPCSLTHPNLISQSSPQTHPTLSAQLSRSNRATTHAVTSRLEALSTLEVSLDHLATERPESPTTGSDVLVRLIQRPRRDPSSIRFHSLDDDIAYSPQDKERTQNFSFARFASILSLDFDYSGIFSPGRTTLARSHIIACAAPRNTNNNIITARPVPSRLVGVRSSLSRKSR